MRVEAPGFKKMDREGIAFEVAQVLGLEALGALERWWRTMFPQNGVAGGKR